MKNKNVSIWRDKKIGVVLKFTDGKKLTATTNNKKKVRFIVMYTVW